METPTHQPTFSSQHEMNQFILEQMINQNKSSSDILKQLLDRGIDTDTAFAAIENAEKQISGKDEKQGRKDMFWGAVWFIGGLAVTLITYSNASEGGGRYTVAYGAIIFGLIQFVRGAYKAI